MTRILSASVHPTNGRRPEGLKRQTFKLEYGGVDLLTGPNGAGKTTRGPLVITAALEGLATVPTDGRRPFIGRLPEGTSVTLETDAGPLTRDLSASRGAAVVEANQRARDLIGLPPTAWDLRDFATGTDGERGKILDAVARAGGQLESWDMDRAVAHVRELLVSEDVIPEGVEPSTWAAPLDRCVAAHPEAPDGATWLQAAEVWAVDQQKTWNRRQKESGGHLGELTQGQVGAPSTSRKDLEAERDDLLQWKAGYRQSAATRSQAQRAADQHAALGVELRERMGRLAERGAKLKEPLPEPSTEIPADVVARLEAAKAELDAPIPAPDGEEVDVSALRDAHIEAAGLAKAAEEARLKANQAASAAEAEYAEAKAATREADAKVKAIADLMGDDVCVHCGEKDPHGTGVKLEAARRDYEAAKAAEEPAHEAASKALDAFNKALAAEHEAGAIAQQAKAAFDAAIHANHAREQHGATVKASRQRDLAGAQAAYDREVAAAKARKDAYVVAEEKREAGLAAARAEWATANRRLQEWSATAAPTVPAPPSAEELARTEEQLATVEGKLKAWAVYDGHIERVRAAKAKYESEHLHWSAVRALVDAVRQARDDVAAAAYRPIHDAASKLLEGSGLPVPYFASPADYGAEVEGRGRVPYAGLSESEQRITAAALVYALATVSGCPCRLVLLDGLEVVQRDHRAPLIRALTEAQRGGLVDNVVMTMATAPGEDLGEIAEIEGLTVHEIERQAMTLEVVEDEVEVEVPVMNREASDVLALAGIGEDSGCPF